MSVYIEELVRELKEIQSKLQNAHFPLVRSQAIFARQYANLAVDSLKMAIHQAELAELFEARENAGNF